MRTFLFAASVAAALSCTTSRQATDADAGQRAADAALDAGAVATPPHEGAAEDAAPAPIIGEWERRTEPYVGMRVAIRDLSPMRAVVTAPPPVTEERLTARARGVPAAVAKAQLECQRSLWKPGEELVTGMRPSRDGFEATILVRDWGFTGACRHADSRAPAHLAVSPDGELTIAVTRGKTVTQRWSRVGP